MMISFIKKKYVKLYRDQTNDDKYLYVEYSGTYKKTGENN